MIDKLRFCNRIYIEYIPLYVILFICPFFCNTDSFLTGITARFIGTISLLFCLTLILFRKTHWKINRVDTIFTAFITFYTLRILLAYPTFRLDNLLAYITLLLLYVYFRNVRQGNRFFLTLYFAGLLQAGWYILQIRGFLPSYHYLFKGTGSFFNPALLAIFLVMGLLAGMASFPVRRKLIVKVLWCVGCILLLCCIVAISSRAAWVALLTGGLWIGWTEGHWSSKLRAYFSSKRSLFLKYICCGILIGIIACGIYGFYRMRQDSVHGRFLIWQVIGSKLTGAFCFGYGPLEALYMPLQAEWFMEHLGSSYNKLAGNNLYAFNELLRIIFEAGIVGLILLVSLILTAGWYAFRGNRTSHYCGAIGIAIVCFGLFSYPFSADLIIAIAVVVVAMIAANIPERSVAVGKIGRSYKYMMGILLPAFLFLVSWEYIQERQADTLLQKAQQDVALLSQKDMLTFYDHFQSHPDFILCYGKTLYNHKLYREALCVLEQGYRLRPSSELVCDLGMCYQQTKKFSQAEEAYTTAAFMTPAHILPQYRLFCLYRETGEEEKAMDIARYILTMSVKVVNTSVLRIRNQAREYVKGH